MNKWTFKEMLIETGYVLGGLLMAAIGFATLVYIGICIYCYIT